MNNKLSSKEFWLDLILTAGTEAYKEIKPIIGTKESRIELKKGAGGDMTLEIDKKAEEKIISELIKGHQAFKLITEELGERIYNQDKTQERDINEIIIVDPIDGSRNAAWGLPISAISIAHASGDKLSDIDCGVIINIYTGDVFHAIKGGGTFKNNVKSAVNSNNNTIKCLFGINLTVNEPLIDYMNRWRFLFDKPLRIRAIGSDALGCALLATGSLDIFTNTQKKTRVLDIAAGYLMILEGGGEIWDMEGEILDAPLSILSRVSFIALNVGLKAYYKGLLDKFKKCNKLQPDFKSLDFTES